MKELIVSMLLKNGHTITMKRKGDDVIINHSGFDKEFHPICNMYKYVLSKEEMRLVRVTERLLKLMKI